MAQTILRKIPDPPPITDAEADALITRYIDETSWSRRRADEAWVVTDSGSVQMWAIMGHLRGAGIAETAAAYDLPEEAIRAALAYYARNREVIDARLVLNDADFGD